MSFRLPSVIVYQELLTSTITPTRPFMDLCIVGPVYQCETAVALDKYNIQTAEETDTSPAQKIYKKEFPNLKVGAIIEDNSAYVTLSNVNVKIWPTIIGAFHKNIVVDNTGAVTVIKSVPGAVGEDLLEAADIKAGDYVDILYTDPVTSKQVVKTAAIHEKTTDSEGNTIYSLQKNLTLPSSMTEFSATVKRSVEGTSVVYPNTHTEGEASGFTITEDPATHTKYINLAVEALKVATTEETGANVYVVDCDVAVSYRALRTDIANDYITISSYDEAVAQFGPANIDNPMSIAAQMVNSAIGNITYKVLPIGSDTKEGYLGALGLLSNSENIYVIEPLTHDKEVITAYADHCKAMSEPEKSKWRIMYANLPMPSTKAIMDACNGKLLTMGADTETVLYGIIQDPTFLGAVPVYTKVEETGTLVKTDESVTTKVYFDDEPVLFTEEGERYAGTNYKVVQLSELASASDYKPEFADKFVIATTADELCERDIPYDKSVVPEGATCYIQDSDSDNGGFITNKVRPTDYIDIYEKPENKNNPPIYRYSLMVKEVLTESACICYTQKYLFETDSYNEQTGEFQKFAFPTTEGDLKDLTDCEYKVTRYLDTTGKADALSAIAKEFNTKRVRFVQPDQIRITVDGVDQLVGGEFLCVSLAAMRAGFPPHQGFSTMGISGIKQVVHANKMFSEEQLAEMASNGVFWVAQDALEELPYVLYQTTTDTKQLETAEDSCVAVVDFASKYYKDNLRDVLGRYNVNTISLNYVKTVINACSNDMTSTSYEYIGPILTSAVLVSISTEADKIKPVIHIEIPYPVNGVDITLQV